MNAERYALFLKALRFEATVSDICHATGLTRQTVAKTLAAMRHQAVAYVCAWEQDALGRWSVARWALGDALDARRPVAVDPAEKQRAYRLRKAIEKEQG